MPTKPSKVSLDATSMQILNTTRAELGGTYADLVPLANLDGSNIREIGAAIMQFQPVQNAFLSALINRIGRVLITSRLYENPWAGFKKGLLEYGETIEEIFVNIAKPHQYNPDTAQTEIFKREIPDVRAAFHYMNYQKFYKVTISNDQLRQAFLSVDGITDLIGRIIDSLYTSANYDELLTMKYMIARAALKGEIYPVTIPTVTAENARSVVSTIKGMANELQFMSNTYNLNGVETYTDTKYLYLIKNAKFDAVIDVEVLAQAFNMEKAEFLGRQILVDSFGKLDNTRLSELFAGDSSYVPLTDEEKATLDAIPALMVDESWFMIFDNYYNMTEQYNGEGLYWNYWYHVWKTFSISPFANAILYTPATPSVTSVTVTPSTATLSKGGMMQLTATVVTAGFASKQVVWTLEDATASTISETGLVTIGGNETVSEITAVATSVYDDTKKGQCAITITV